ELVDRYNGVGWEKDKSGLPQGRVDTSFVPKGWNMKETGRWSASEVHWRLDFIRTRLREIWVVNGAGRRKIEVVIVTHGSFLRKLVNDVKFEDVELTHCLFNNGDGEFEEISKEELDILRDVELEDLPMVLEN
ncbi:hypothetical protein N431DRAFT_334387, partial [Stipitochalara longipes BDJ]